MAWVFAPSLTVHAQPQAYTRLADRLYLFENLDGSGFRVELPVDEEGIVLDYPNLFRRVADNECASDPSRTMRLPVHRTRLSDDHL